MVRVAAAVADDGAAVRVHLQQAGGDAFEEVPVVGDGDGGAAPGTQVLLQPVQGGGVEVVGGLVEQQDLRRARQQRGQPQPDLLPAGERGDGAVAVDQAQAEAAQGALGPGVGLVAAAQFEEGQQVAVLGQGRRVAGGHRGLQVAQAAFDGAQSGEAAVEDLLDGHGRGQPLLLGEVAHAAGGLDDDLALVGAVHPGEEAQQGALAGAVLADDPGALTRAEGAGDRGEDGTAVEGLADVERGDLYGHASSPKRSRTGRPGAGRPGERFAGTSITPLVRQLMH